ncbi:T9SS type A sorting domain-containing protein, partial [Hymenobacter agri]
TQTATRATAELDLAGLPAGLYAVRVTAGSGTATQQLAVE